MNRKASLYALIGGIVGGLLVLAVCSVMPIGAENENATFGTITCTGLRVVDVDGNDRVWLSGLGLGGSVVIHGPTGELIELETLFDPSVRITGPMGSVVLLAKHNGGVVSVRGANDNGKIGERVALGINDNGGLLRLFNNDSADITDVNSIGGLLYMDDQGGRLDLWKHGEHVSRALVSLGVNDNGGLLEIRGHDGEKSAQMDIDKHGGRVGIFGKGNRYSRAVMAVNEYGNGGVSTWDKNRYRLD